jgi:Iap family predicted aminopeptidase
MSFEDRKYHFPKDFGFNGLYQTLDFEVKSVFYILGKDLIATKTNFNNEFVLIEIDDFQTFNLDLVADIRCKGIIFLVNNYKSDYFTMYKTDNLAMIQEKVKTPHIYLNKESFPKSFLNSLILNQSNKFNVSFKLNTKPKLQSTENVVGFIEGSDVNLKNEVIVISAHYDHLGVSNKQVFNGADDNGSGTTALLEIAQAFQRAKEDGKNPKRSILFIALTGEEMGLFGSSYYVSNPFISLNNTIADLNIDMIGRATYPKEKDTFSVYVIGSNMLSDDLHNTQETANTKYTHLNFDYLYNDVNEPLRLYYRSDHYNFAKNGIPSVFYFGGFHDDYHKETDDIESINFEKIEQIAKMVFHTTWLLGNAESRPVLK